MAGPRFRRTAGVSTWSLWRRIPGVALAAVVTALVIGGLASFSAWSSRGAALTERATLLPAVIDAGDLYTALVDQESGERGYLLSAQSKFLSPYIAGKQQTQVLIKRLRLQVARYPGVSLLVQEVHSAYQVWLTETAIPGIAVVRSGDLVSATTSETLGLGKERFDMIRQRVSALLSRLAAVSSAVNKKVQARNSETLALVLLGTVLAVGMLGLGASILNHLVAKPIGDLVGEVRQVAEGDLDHQIEPSGPPEISSLAADVEAMRRRLRRGLEETRQAREALALRDPVLLRLRQELEPDWPKQAGGGITVAGRLVPAEGVLAGDWYQVAQLSPERYLAAVVDISGHGPESGLFALHLKHLLLPALRMGHGPGEAFHWVAEQLGETDEQFATGVALELDPYRHQMLWANAGHPPMLLWRQGQMRLLGSTGPVLGPFPGKWDTNRSDLLDGDVLVICTDGILEARDEHGSEFGIEGLSDQVARRAEAGVEEVIEGIISAVRTHAGGNLADDATVLAIEVDTGTAAPD